MNIYTNKISKVVLKQEEKDLLKNCAKFLEKIIFTLIEEGYETVECKYDDETMLFSRQDLYEIQNNLNWLEDMKEFF